MSRRTAAEVEQDASRALVASLDHLGLGASVVAGRDAAGFAVQVGGVVLHCVVKPVVSAAEGNRLAHERSRERALVVVADRIADDAKEAFRKAGMNFYDRRGQLRIVVPPLIIDAVVPSDVVGSVSSSGPLSSQVVKEVAITCLLTPEQSHGVRDVAAYLDRAPSAVSKAMAELREDGLLTSRNEPTVPDLFHELLTVWRRRQVPLADVPQPGRGNVNRQLELGLDHPETTAGWALTDTVAAASWRMPVVARGDYPPDFYVPSDADLRRARSLLGDAASADQRACTVAVAPVRLVCLRRLDHSQTSGEAWPVANHIVVALDIAQDKARGIEAIEQWQPEGIARAW